MKQQFCYCYIFNHHIHMHPQIEKNRIKQTIFSYVSGCQLFSWFFPWIHLWSHQSLGSDWKYSSHMPLPYLWFCLIGEYFEYAFLSLFCHFFLEMWPHNVDTWQAFFPHELIQRVIGGYTWLKIQFHNQYIWISQPLFLDDLY